MTRVFGPYRTLGAGFAAAAFVLSAALPAAARNETSAQPDLAGTASADTAPATKGEKRLAKLLEGRVAGEPQSCIGRLPSQRVQTINGTAYVYGSGSTIYVQRTRSPERISNRDALVTNRFSVTDLCRHDVTTRIDPINGIITGVVFFDDFVPYTREKTESAAEG